MLIERLCLFLLQDMCQEMSCLSDTVHTCVCLTLQGVLFLEAHLVLINLIQTVRLYHCSFLWLLCQFYVQSLSCLTEKLLLTCMSIWFSVSRLIRAQYLAYSLVLSLVALNIYHICVSLCYKRRWNNYKQSLINVGGIIMNRILLNLLWTSAVVNSPRLL